MSHVILVAVRVDTDDPYEADGIAAESAKILEEIDESARIFWSNAYAVGNGTLGLHLDKIPGLVEIDE